MIKFILKIHFGKCFKMTNDVPEDDFQNLNDIFGFSYGVFPPFIVH